jgi:hypothetical protein
MRYDTAAASQHRLPPAPVLLEMILVQQKSSLGEICSRSARRNFNKKFRGKKPIKIGI